jgi:hypothetical protein
MADEFAKRRPLSKYSIEATIHANPIAELDLQALSLASDETLYVYEKLQFHRYAVQISAGQWKAALRRTRGTTATPLLVANSDILLPARNKPSLLDMSATVAKRQVIAYTLKRHRGNIEKAAAALGVSLYSLVKEMRLLGTPIPAKMPENQRGLLTAAKAINPAVWLANEEDAPPYLEDGNND